MLSVGLGPNWHTLQLNESFCVAQFWDGFWIILAESVSLVSSAETLCKESSQICSLTLLLLYNYFYLLHAVTGLFQCRITRRKCALISTWQKMRVDHRRCSVSACLWPTERRCETGTDTCVLKWQLPLHDNFSPPKTRVCDSLTFDSMSYSCKFLSIFFFTCSKHGPLWDFNYLAHVSIAQHSYCEFVTLFLFSCSFVSFKLPVASKRKANKSIFSLPC